MIDIGQIRETTTTTGTGQLTLAGAVAPYAAFGSVLADGDTCEYVLTDPTSGDWEVGIGTYVASGTKLTRTTINASSNGGAAVNLAAGTKDISLTALPRLIPGGGAVMFLREDGSWQHVTLHETGGPTDLAVGAVADGQATERSGSTLIGRPRAVVKADAASTANENVASASAAVDGATLTSGVSVVLLKDQTTPAEGGLYIWNGNGNAYTRVASLPAGASIPLDLVVNVVGGTVNGDTLWATDHFSAVGVIGTNQWTFYKVGPSSSGSVPSGTGFRHITSGSEDATAQFEPDTDGTLAANSDTALATQKATKTYADTGDAALAALLLGNRFPAGLHQDPAIAATAFSSLQSNAVYIGKAPKANPTVVVICEVRTLFSTGGASPFAEVVIASGAFSANAAPTLTARGSTSVTATFNTTGTKTTSISTSGVAAGDDLWVVFGSRTSVPGGVYQILAAIPDHAQHGIVCNLGATQPSALSASAMSLAANNYVPPWFSAVFS